MNDILRHILYRISSVWQRVRVCLRREVIIGTFAINIMGLMLPIVILQLYDRIIPNEAWSTLSTLVAALVFILVLETTLRIARILLMNKLGANFEEKASLDILRTMLNADLATFEKRRHSDYMERIKALENIRDIQFGQNILALLDFPFIIIYLLLISFFTGWLVLIPLSLFIVFSIVSAYISKALYAALVERDTVFEQRHNFLLEVLQGIQTLKPLAMEKQMIRRYERLQGRSAEAIYKLSYVNNLIQSSTATLSQFTMILFVTVGAIPASNGSLSIGALAAGSMLAGRILQPASRALNFWMQWQTAKVSENRILDLIAIKQDTLLTNTDKLQLDGRISLNKISFKHDGGEDYLFRNLNITVEKNEFVSIVGNNGSGKTTLSKILASLLIPDSGTITVNDVPASTLHHSDLRKQISLVPQRGVLFNGTILDNLTAFRHKEQTKDAITLATKIGLNENIMRMPEGLSSRVDATLMDNMPEGLRQRIVLVRALLGPIKILIFDDAATGYDPENIVKLLAYFREIKGSKTIITLTHDNIFHELCDNCYKLANGELTHLLTRRHDETNEEKRLHTVSLTKPQIVGGKYND